jgi:gamma-glutamyltranspeptidase/glutathione hydrolase
MKQLLRKALKPLSATLALILLFMTNCKNDTSDISWHAEGNGGIVAAGPKPSVQAGLEILAHGGNAVDGAVATIFNLAICDYGSFCVGGEVPFMFYEKNSGRVIVFNGMGEAPGDTAAISWCYKNGIPNTGIRSATVPSAVSTLLKALEVKGTMSFEQVIDPTLRLLDEHAENWHSRLAATLRKLISTEKSTAGTREQKIKAARDRFYKGDIADELNEYYISSGAFLRKSDLEAHETVIEEPVTVNYRGYDVYKCNTWTQGPVLLQTLKILENFDLKSMGVLSPRYIHVTVEAMKLAFADRDTYYGDPDFVKVPLKELLSAEYTKLRYPLISPDTASTEIRPGDPYNMTALTGKGQYWPGEKGTTTCVVADKWGNVVAATPSANATYGVCEKLGIAHNTRLYTLNIQPGHPNSLKAGKKPRITLTPTIILKDSKPFMAISVAGGDMQEQVALQLMLDKIEFGIMPADAITVPRFRTYHTEDSFKSGPDQASRYFKIGGLDIDSIDMKTLADLKRLGHVVSESVELIGDPVMIWFDQQEGKAYAAGEPRYAKGKFCGALNR